MPSGEPEAEVFLRCRDLTEAIDAFIDDHGFRLEGISPADAPRRAELSLTEQHLALILTCPSASQPSGAASDVAGTDPVEISRSSDGDWGVGRAEMQYRDLVPSRLGGRLIASHIRVPHAGPVPDQVHFHEVGFQLILCLTGWVRLVYQDQGEPFVLEAGDAILQAPTQRHRVLESSASLEVLEVSSPAEHPTRFDHDLDLPNGERLGLKYQGQPYVHSLASRRSFRPLAAGGQNAAAPSGTSIVGFAGDPNGAGWTISSTGISPAEGHRAEVTVLRATATAAPLKLKIDEPALVFVLAGSADFVIGTKEVHPALDRHDSLVLSQQTGITITSGAAAGVDLAWISLAGLL